jgi:deoxycytidylate deaminase
MRIELPYLPENREILYVPETNVHMQKARTIALEQSLDAGHKTGAVVVKNGLELGSGANGSVFHEVHGCERKRLGIPTGEGYERCEGCSPKNHAEQKALATCGDVARGADVYLWGHWWCCQSCWQCMIDAGIENVYLPVGAEKMFRR